MTSGCTDGQHDDHDDTTNTTAGCGPAAVGRLGERVRDRKYKRRVNRKAFVFPIADSFVPRVAWHHSLLGHSSLDRSVFVVLVVPSCSS
jgi:hypothetical protein